MSESEIRAAMSAAMAHPVQDLKQQRLVPQAEPSQQPGADRPRQGGRPADPANPGEA
jgi:hypothetical protein